MWGGGEMIKFCAFFMVFLCLNIHAMDDSSNQNQEWIVIDKSTTNIKQDLEMTNLGQKKLTELEIQSCGSLVKQSNNFDKNLLDFGIDVILQAYDSCLNKKTFNHSYYNIFPTENFNEKNVECKPLVLTSLNIDFDKISSCLGNIENSIRDLPESFIKIIIFFTSKELGQKSKLESFAHSKKITGENFLVFTNTEGFSVDNAFNIYNPLHNCYNLIDIFDKDKRYKDSLEKTYSNFVQMWKLRYQGLESGVFENEDDALVKIGKTAHEVNSTSSYLKGKFLSIIGGY
jgi:hypothetical protein